MVDKILFLDFSSLSSHPVGAKTVKTSVKSKSLSPVWNETFEMIVDSADGQLLYLDVFDDDQGSKDDELGR